MTNLAAVAPGGACQPSHGTNGVFTQSADGRCAKFFPARPITAADLATADKSGLEAGLCLGPAVDPGASGGDGTGNFRTDEPNSVSSLISEVMSGRHDSNVRPLRPERSALARLSYAPMGATTYASHMGET